MNINLKEVNEYKNKNKYTTNYNNININYYNTNNNESNNKLINLNQINDTFQKTVKYIFINTK